MAKMIIKGRIPRLSESGFFVESFDSYVHTRPTPHNLDVILFSWFVSGKGRHQIGGNVYEALPGSVGITFCGQNHDILTDEPMQIMNVYIDPDTFRLPVLPGLFMKYLHILLPLHPSFTRRRLNMTQISCSRPQPITGILRQIEGELAADRFGSPEIARELFKVFLMLLITEIVDNGHIAMTENQTPGSDAVMKVMAYLDEHFNEEITLDLLTRLFHTSRATLCRNFKAQTGTTIIGYLTQKRIENCCFHLTSGTDSITRIALAGGFNDISFFNKKFRQITGKTPREFRRQPL